jgi:aryl-alcohol dehydrogenase-like predicted oxidoreductase
MRLDDYVTLGRSGLRVSPLCLGTMTFGTGWGWGTDEAGAGALLDRYVEAGGNFVDSADLYLGGESEAILGRLVRARGLRDRLVLATKFGFGAEPGNPNAGGNGRKNVIRALEGSLRRLGTDRVDLYWLHAWDGSTPVEEVLRTLDDLVRAGKVLHVGLSNVPAWYAARFQTLAEGLGKERLAALQLEYSLVERSLEREHLPMALELGLALTPWSPLASGFLAGKYRREGGAVIGAGRLEVVRGSGNPAFEKFTERNWAILEVLREVAAELERTPAEVALAWVIGRPGVTSTLVGATRPEQLEGSLAALALELPAAALARLEAASRLDPGQPYTFFADPLRGMVNGARVRAWRG